MRFNDDLRALCAALPNELKLDSQTFEEVLRRFADQRPEYWTTPISSDQAAALLGKTCDALRAMRSRGEGPAGFTKIEGGYIYPSRLHVLEWVANQIEQAKLEPSQRKGRRMLQDFNSETRLQRKIL